jgi:hypothetical protein
MNWGGFGWKGSWLKWGFILEFTWRDWGKLRKPHPGYPVPRERLELNISRMKAQSAISKAACSVMAVMDAVILHAELSVSRRTMLHGVRLFG